MAEEPNKPTPEEQPQAGGRPGHPKQAPWERTVFRMFLVLIVAGSGLYVFRSCRNLPLDTVERAADKTLHVMTNVGQTLATVASAFRQGTVTLSLDSTGTELSDTKYFQFKKIRQTEIFTHTDQAVTGFGYLPLPEIIVEARVPVEYTYYLDLAAPWTFLLEDRTLHVLTPPIRYNKPAVDISRLKYDVKKDSVLRDADTALDHLRKSLTSLAFLKAGENLKLVKATGREPVAEFVRDWLFRSFTDGSNYQVRVHWPGEPLPAEMDPYWERSDP